jgi:hypothetical protein
MKKEYTCTNCNFYQEYDGNEEMPICCLNCGSKSSRIIYRRRQDTKPVGTRCGVDALYKENVRYSYSLGCRPSQLKEMQKLHPNAKFVKKGHGYVMEIKNRAEKLQRMKERGFEEFSKHDFD